MLVERALHLPGMDWIDGNMTLPNAVRRQAEILAELAPLVAAAARPDDQLAFEPIERRSRSPERNTSPGPHGSNTCASSLAHPRAETVPFGFCAPRVTRV